MLGLYPDEDAVGGHTPGPWRVYEAPQGSFEISPDAGPYRVICSRRDWPHRAEESRANARLIAAAPDLLDACKEFVRKVDAGEARSVRSYAQMTAAIAKAEGKP